MTDNDEMKVLRVSARAHQIVRELAERERRTLTAQIEIIIERAAEMAREKPINQPVSHPPVAA